MLFLYVAIYFEILFFIGKVTCVNNHTEIFCLQFFCPCGVRSHLKSTVGVGGSKEILEFGIWPPEKKLNIGEG